MLWGLCSKQDKVFRKIKEKSERENESSLKQSLKLILQENVKNKIK